MDIQQLFQEFLMENEFARKLRPETIRGYKEVFTLFSKLIPDLQLNSINTVTVTQFFKTLNERKRLVGRGKIKVGIKKSTVATYWSKLNSFFSWLQIKGHIAINPFTQIKYPKPVYDDKKYLKKEEVEKILAAIHIHYNNDLLILKRNLVMFNLLLFCGLRREELMLLEVRDIDLERKILTIRAENSKSAMSRQLPLPGLVVPLLIDYLQERRKYTCAELFVSSISDRALGYDGIKHLVLRLNRTSGVHFHLHQFRHTFALNFLKQTGNLFALKELLGHRDIRMTATYLRHLPVDEMRSDIEKLSMDGLL